MYITGFICFSTKWQLCNNMSCFFFFRFGYLLFYFIVISSCGLRLSTSCICLFLVYLSLCLPPGSLSARLLSVSCVPVPFHPSSRVPCAPALCYTASCLSLLSLVFMRFGMFRIDFSLEGFLMLRLVFSVAITIWGDFNKKGNFVQSPLSKHPSFSFGIGFLEDFLPCTTKETKQAERNCQGGRILSW